jgi:hypothetical protein
MVILGMLQEWWQEWWVRQIAFGVLGLIVWQTIDDIMEWRRTSKLDREYRAEVEQRRWEE